MILITFAAFIGQGGGNSENTRLTSLRTFRVLQKKLNYPKKSLDCQDFLINFYFFFMSFEITVNCTRVKDDRFRTLGMFKTSIRGSIHHGFSNFNHRYSWYAEL